MKKFDSKSIAIFVLLILLGFFIRRSYQAGHFGHLDPGGISRRDPHSMHAHQNEWSSQCGAGNALLQSPISITTPLLKENNFSPISLKILPAPGDLIDVGHTFQVRYATAAPGGKAEFEGKSYHLRQFHFHKPSEHLIDGKQYEMEIHFVFFPMDKQKLPKALVLGFPIIEGKFNAELNKIWKHLPPYREGYGERESENLSWGNAIATRELEVDSLDHHEKVLANHLVFDLSKMIPEKADFFVYSGSLTTPSCDEKITHAVALTPIQFEHEQIEHFEGYYEGNNRDIQPAGNLKNRKFRRASMAFQTQ